jgi:UDP-N-acetyl-D-mannosaminuronic acid dehydrogenase
VKSEIVLTDTTTAEMVKLMENTFRDVNIALANEFALIAEKLGVNVWEAIEIANRHPRVKILRPGPGVGGHCIAVDPWFLVEAAPEQASLIRQARLVNDGMPEHIVQLVKQAISGIDRPVIACLGLTYKADVDDLRESPAVEVVKRLVSHGFIVRSYDPYVRQVPGMEATQVNSLQQALDKADCVVVLTDHSEFRRLSPKDLGVTADRIIDTRHALSWDKVS